jgi:hypothetical protein
MREIADVLEIDRATVNVWRNRGLLPEPDGTPSGTPIWLAETIRPWLVAKGADLAARRKSTTTPTN